MIRIGTVIGSKMAGFLPIRKAQLIGITLFAIAVVAMLGALYFRSAPIFLIITALMGICWGLAYTSSMESILEHITTDERAGVLSLIFVISYGGAALPSIAIGKVLGAQSLLAITAKYAILIGILWIALVIYLLLKKTI